MPLRTLLEIPKMNAGEKQSLLESINKYIPLVKLASFERYLLPIRTGQSNIVLPFQFSPYMLTPFWQDVMNSSTYSEMGMICYFDHIWGLTNHCQTRVGDFVKWGLGALKRQNVSPRPGNEPGSPAIHMERGRLLTGGYTDHYTNEDLLIGKSLTLNIHQDTDSKTSKPNIK